MSNTEIGIAEAADLAGCSKDTIRRAIQRDQLPARMDEGPSGFQYWLLTEDVEAWARLRRPRQGYAQPLAQPSAQASADTAQAYAEPAEPYAQAPAEGSFDVVPLDAFREVVALLEKTQQDNVRAEKRALLLEFQLQQQRTLLTENAESLCEREARAKQAEAREEEARQATEQAAAEALQAQEEAQQAKDLLEQAQTRLAKLEADWAERRRPWWQKVFRTGS